METAPESYEPAFFYENNPNLSEIERFTNNLRKITLIPVFAEFSNRVETLIKTYVGMTEIMGTKANNLFEVPRFYLQHFYNQYEPELNTYSSLHRDAFQALLYTFESYFDVMTKMVKTIPKDKLDESTYLSHRVKCTIEGHDRDLVLQKAYYCDTCGILDDGMVCEGCMRSCHMGHKVRYRGILTGFCDCRFETKECKLIETCSLKQTGNKYVKQPCFVCHSCKMNTLERKMLCQFCVEKCHFGHEVEFTGIKNGFCDCDEMYNFCRKQSSK